MSISTKKGDNKKSVNYIDGEKQEINKDDLYFEFVGKLDNFHSNLTLVKHYIIDNEMNNLLDSIMQDAIPAIYASLPLAGDLKVKFNKQDLLNDMESYIKVNEDKLQLNSKFYELGQTKLSSMIDIVRSISREVERSFVSLSNDKKLDDDFYKLNFSYLNRTSDLFFVMARVVEQEQNKLKERT